MSEKQEYRFEGTAGKHATGLDELQQQLGYTIDVNILDFITVFGGTRLFIGSYGNCTSIYPLNHIIERNLEINNEISASFFPTFVVLGDDIAGDFICLYKNTFGEVHFGNMHHEAIGGGPEAWMEGFTAAHFIPWLEMFTQGNGATLPDKTCSYTIFETIEYIYPEMAHRYLKAGKPLALFLSVTEWPGFYTYNWFRFEKTETLISAVLIRSVFTNGDSNDVSQFETLNKNYNEEDKAASRFTGSFEDCLNRARNMPGYATPGFLRLSDLSIHFSGMQNSILKK